LKPFLGSTAGFWLNREAQYRAQLAKIEEQERLKTWTPLVVQKSPETLMNKEFLLRQQF
jgi:HTH-type transcriptional regulator/antitoxin HigA